MIVMILIIKRWCLSCCHKVIVIFAVYRVYSLKVELHQVAIIFGTKLTNFRLGCHPLLSLLLLRNPKFYSHFTAEVIWVVTYSDGIYSCRQLSHVSVFTKPDVD